MPTSFTSVLLSCGFWLLPNPKQSNQMIPKCAAFFPAPPSAPLARGFPSRAPGAGAAASHYKAFPAPPEPSRELTQEYSSRYHICMTDGSFALSTSSRRSPIHPSGIPFCPIHPSGIPWGYLLSPAAFHPLAAHPCPHSYVLPAKHHHSDTSAPH